MDGNLPKIPTELYQDFQHKIDQLQSSLPKIPNMIIDDLQKKMDQLHTSLSKSPNISAEMLASMTDNTKNLQETVLAFEKRMAQVMTTLETLSKHDQLVVSDLVLNRQG
jgi:hypothetical protein